jgi:tetratricopeptide (TPR) repeat protein
MLLMDYWPLRKFNLKTLLEKTPLFALGVIFAIITYISQHRTATTISPIEYGPRHVLLVLCHNIVFYPYKMILPVRLSSYYPFPKPFDLSSTAVLAGIAGTCVLIPLLLVSLRRTRAALTGWLIFFAAIFPTLGAVGFTDVIASDKYAYLPVIGLLMLVTSFLVWVCRSKKIAIAATAIVLALAGAEAFATQRYLTNWKDTITLNKYMMQLTPESPSLYTNLGFAYGRLGRYDEEIEAYKQAIKSAPYMFELRFNLGCAYESMGRWDEAIEAYKQAIEIKPSNFKTYNNLGAIYGKAGQWNEAAQMFHQTLKLKPKNLFAQYNLGIIYSKQGRWSEAAELFTQVVQQQPDDINAYINLGGAYGQMGRTAEAIEVFQRLIKIKPDSYLGYGNLGVTYMQLGRWPEAIEAFKQAVKIKPDYAKGHYNLGLAYVNIGGKEAAMEQYEVLRRLNPALAQNLLDHIK